jgi:8-oxo-dGTP pyrophosphatase MutT (NUDIX family)
MSTAASRPSRPGPADGFDPHAVPVRDAATVMVVRDGASGLELFMLRRTLDAVFAGGLYVFPGGAVDDADRHAELEAVCIGRTDAEASALLQVPDGGLAYWVAAIRECFEEAGVLLAVGANGVVRFDDPAVAERFTGHRHAVHAGTIRLVDLCRQEGLQLDAGGIEYVSHWITPVGERRRFDTRFFVARAPAAQEPLHDDRETIESLWINPAQALAAFDRGELAMIPPTLANLRFLADHDRADAALAAAAVLPPPVTIQPKLAVDEHGKVRVVLPTDPEFDQL